MDTRPELQTGLRDLVRDYVDRVRSLQFARRFASVRCSERTLLDTLAAVCYECRMWIRLAHLLFIAVLVAGNVDFAGMWCASASDFDDPLPVEPAEEECESADEIELDKFHTGLAYLPPKAGPAVQQWQWNVRSFGDAQLAECSHGVIGVRGPPRV